MLYALTGVYTAIQDITTQSPSEFQGGRNQISPEHESEPGALPDWQHKGTYMLELIKSLLVG